MGRRLINVFVIWGIIFSIGQAVDPHAYVINTTGETLSKINLANGMVRNNIITLGSDILSYPNQIVIRDTLAYVIASGTNEIQIINLNNETTVDFIPMPQYSNPYWMDFSDARFAYVSLLFNNSVAHVDVINRMIVDEIPVGNGPEGLVITGGKVFVANSAYNFSTGGYDPGTVSVIEIATNTVVKTISTNLNPQMLCLDDSGHIHVVCTGDYAGTTGRINVIDPISETVVASFAVGGYPAQISIGPDGVAYVCAPDWTYNSRIFTYNAATYEIYHDSHNPITVGVNTNGLSLFQDTTCFTASFDDTIRVIDSSGTYLKKYAVGDNPLTMDFNYLPGDANGDYDVNLLDILVLIGWIYGDDQSPRWPLWRANVNGDTAYNLLDILYLIAFVYEDGPRPVAGARWVHR